MPNRLTLLFLVPALVWAQSVSAEPVSLKCRTQEGLDTVDLIVDMERRTMSWGVANYGITAATEEYITAFRKRDEVGGEVFVLHRATGDYWRASVGAFCQDARCESTKMGTGTYLGRCALSMF